MKPKPLPVPAVLDAKEWAELKDMFGNSRLYYLIQEFSASGNSPTRECDVAALMRQPRDKTQLNVSLNRFNVALRLMAVEEAPKGGESEHKIAIVRWQKKSR